MPRKKQEVTSIDPRNYPEKRGHTYEVELRVRVPDWLKHFSKKNPNPFGRALRQARKRQEQNESNPAVAFVDAFGRVGHVYFVLRERNRKGRAIREDEVGFTSAEGKNLKGARKGRGVGVPGIVVNQKKYNPKYRDSLTIPVSREAFLKMAHYVRKTADDPPAFAWPSFNCVRFTSKAFKAGGLRKPQLFSTDMPLDTVFFIRRMKQEMKKKENPANPEAQKKDSGLTPTLLRMEMNNTR